MCKEGENARGRLKTCLCKNFNYFREYIFENQMVWTMFAKLVIFAKKTFREISSNFPTQAAVNIQQ
jgi:hypothetical protein